MKYMWKRIHIVNQIAHVSSGILYMGATASGLRAHFDTWPASQRRISDGLGLRTRDNDITVCPLAWHLSYRDIGGIRENPSATQPDVSPNYLCRTSWPQNCHRTCYTSNVHHLRYIFGTTCCHHGIYQQLIVGRIQSIQNKICSGYGCRVFYLFQRGND